MNMEGGVGGVCFPTWQQILVTEDPEGKNKGFGVIDPGSDPNSIIL